MRQVIWSTTRLLLVAAVAALALIAAGTAQPQGVREGGTFRIAFPANRVESIDPYLDNFPAMSFVFNATCGSLLARRDQPLPAGRELVPELAERLPQVSSNGKAYTFTIRRGPRFSTGAPVTARDVAASVRRALNPDLKTYSAPAFLNVVGARAYWQGRATALPGVVVKGNRITFRLRKPQPDFVESASLCVLPADLPASREGVRAPVPSAGPYTLTRYVPGRQIVVERNRFYRGVRPHHVDRFDVTLVEDETSLVEDVERGTYDWAWMTALPMSAQVPRLVARYGVNKSRFFVTTGVGICMLPLNASRPLFRDNPRLRRAVNFAIDRKALVREAGPRFSVPADQYLQPHQIAFRDAHIYPSRPNVREARRLASGNTRSGAAVFLTRDDVMGRSHGAIVRANLAAIGIDVDVRPLPSNVLFQTLATRPDSFDIGWICWLNSGPYALNLHAFFDGRTLNDPRHFNYSYFDSARVNRSLDEVSRLTGPAFFRSYGALDIELARDYAPAVAYAYGNDRTLVSARVGCVVLRPTLDLAAVCLRE